MLEYSIVEVIKKNEYNYIGGDRLRVFTWIIAVITGHLMTRYKIRLETKAKLFIQQKILDKVYELAWSYIMDYENSLNPYDERRNRIAPWRDIAVIDCNAEESIILEAGNLQAIGLKVFDALHVACAIYLKCDYFITTDTHLLKKTIIGVKVVDPIEFIRREVRK